MLLGVPVVATRIGGAPNSSQRVRECAQQLCAACTWRSLYPQSRAALRFLSCMLKSRAALALYARRGCESALRASDDFCMLKRPEDVGRGVEQHSKSTHKAHKVLEQLKKQMSQTCFLSRRCFELKCNAQRRGQRSNSLLTLTKATAPTGSSLPLYLGQTSKRRMIPVSLYTRKAPTSLNLYVDDWLNDWLQGWG
jgi:hypothetical protein